jgi:hypothetical protein
MLFGCPLCFCIFLQVQMPAGATLQHGGRLTAQDVISSDLITFSSMQVGLGLAVLTNMSPD